MEKIFTKLNNWKLIILMIFIIGGVFYWHEIRPSRIYSQCHEEAKEKVLKNKFTMVNDFGKYYDLAYEGCLRTKGINN